MIKAGTLIPTKLSFPRIQPHTVSRHRPFQGLEKGVSGKLTLVIAPAGYGKTTLVMDWMKDRNAAAWLSLDAQDSSLYVFWSHVVAAIAPLYSGFSEKIVPFFEHLNPESYHVFIHGIIKHLDKREQSIILILDDYYFIDHSTIDDSLAYFLERMPEHVHVILLTRVKCPGWAAGMKRNRKC